MDKWESIQYKQANNIYIYIATYVDSEYNSVSVSSTMRVTRVRLHDSCYTGDVGGL